jgi:hypothetical protein
MQTAQAPALKERSVLKKPPTYLLLSILALILIAFPIAIVPIVYGVKVSKKFNRGDFEGAERMSRKARLWLVISVAVGVVSTAILIWMGYV